MSKEGREAIQVGSLKSEHAVLKPKGDTYQAEVVRSYEKELESVDWRF